MDPLVVGRVRSDAVFAALERKRNGLSWRLTIATLAVYFGLLSLAFFAPHLLATPVFGVISLGILLGLLVIASAVVFAALYVWRANTEFDAMAASVRRNLRWPS